MKRFLVMVLVFSLVIGLANDISFSVTKEKNNVIVLSQMELLAGILTQTTEVWDKTLPSNSGDNDYYIELKNFFKPYKNHKAIQLANVLIKENRFTYNIIPLFAINLTELPSLKVRDKYGKELTDRIGDSKKLESFRLAMLDLAIESKFKEKFYDKHKDFYEEYRTIAKASLTQSVELYVERLFGDKGYNNIIILACGLKTTGAYSATFTDTNGNKTVYSTLSPIIKTGFMQFAVNESLLVHEFGHAYVNPLTIKYSKLIMEQDINKLYLPVEDKLKQQAYVGLDSFINESILYGLMVYVIKQEGNPFYINIAKDMEKSGFYLTSFIVDQLEDYELNRNQYSTFDEFYPVLIKKISTVEEKQ